MPAEVKVLSQTPHKYGIELEFEIYDGNGKLVTTRRRIFSKLETKRRVLAYLRHEAEVTIAEAEASPPDFTDLLQKRKSLANMPTHAEVNAEERGIGGGN